MAKLNVRVFGGEGTETEEEVSKDVGPKEVLSKVTSDGRGVEASVPPFLLSEGLSPVPPKLVKKIQSGDYVDMTELLRDNMEMGRRQSLDSTAYIGGGAGSTLSQGGSRLAKLDRLFWDVC